MLKVKEKGKAQLILDSSSSESEEEAPVATKTKGNKASKGKKDNNGEFTINKGYAERYDNWRNLEEMQKLKDRLGINDISELNEDDDSSSESSSEDEPEWTPDKEKAFLKTLACLKTKNPKIYSDEFGFFKNVEEDKEKDSAVGAKKRKKEDKKPYTVRDHERTMVMEKAGQLSDDEEDDDDDNQPKEKSYPEELASIKTEFSKALNEIDSSDDEDGDGLLGTNLLKRRTDKSVEENEKEQEEYKLWLKGELEKLDKGKLPKEDVKELKALREYWNDDKLDEGEKFLRDYILNKKYIDPTKGDKDYIPSYNEVVHDDDELSNDEKFEAEREEFEHKYNFRFEEPDQEFIKRYPRTIQESMRREDTKRKEQREKVKERKEELKARKKEEVQRLKALKRKEIMDKIQKLHEISGDPDLNLSEVDIDGDFDPEEYDRRMQQIFNDDYYQQGADDEKPVFEYDEEIDGEEENWEAWVPARKEDDKVAEESEETDEEEEEPTEHKAEVVEFFGRRSKRAAAQKELIEASKGKRGRKKRSAFLEVLEREKPKFDPKIHKSFEQYFEEYYKLDFEDIIGGDVKCRFKYHKTVPNDFGLTTEEILKAEDRELNQWASLKKTYQYRGEEEEVYEVKAYRKKAEQEKLKKRVLLSVYQPVPEKSADEEDEDVEEKQKKKRKNKKKKKNKVSENNIEEQTKPEPEVVKKDKKSKNDLLVANEEIEEGKATSPSHRSEKNKPRKRTSSQSSQNTSVSSGTTKLSKRQRKNLKRLGRSKNGDTSAITSPAKPETKPTVKKDTTKSMNKDKRGKKRKTSEETNGVSVDEDRLRSYGLNPKKFKKQMKYGNSAAQK